MSKLALSVQLYTLRELVSKDFAAVAAKMAEIGLNGVELAGFGNLKTASEVRKALDAVGLAVSGAHVGVDAVLAEPNKVIDEHKALGNGTIICPWAALDGKGEAEYREFAGKLEKAGELLTAAGLTFAYHNHSFELKPLRKGLDGMDVLLGQTRPEHVKAELDLFWIRHGGHDPAAYLEKVGGRCVAVHLKDMEIGPDRRFANVGEGILDFRSIAAAGQKAGVKWYVVEQDDCYGQDPVEAVRTGVNNLRRMGLA